jgi:hypothetical protein
MAGFVKQKNIFVKLRRKGLLFRFLYAILLDIYKTLSAFAGKGYM